MNGDEFRLLDGKLTRLLELQMSTREEIAGIKPIIFSLDKRVSSVENRQESCVARRREEGEEMTSKIISRQWSNRTMIGGFLIALLAAIPGWIVLLSGCSVSQDDNAGARPLPSDWQQRLAEIETISAAWAERREGASTNDPDFDASTGDALLFDGLLCSVGIQLSCDAVIASQGADGRFWRSPQWVEKPYGSGSTFSRDMALGALAYIIRTGDKPRAEAWGSYLRANNYALCPDEANCKLLSPAIWSMFRHVFDRVNAARFGAMWAMRDGHETLQPLAEQTAIGSGLHLIGVQVYLLKLAGVSKPTTASTLVGRMPGNPFYQWLAGDRMTAYNQTVQLCPLERPAARHSWQWERPIPNDRPELGSGGWDCVFMARLLRYY